MSLLFPRAPVSLVLRLWDRNSTEVDSLESRISAVVRDWLGGPFAATHDRKIQFVADALYFAVTLLMARRTIGEEVAGVTLASIASSSTSSSAAAAAASSLGRAAVGAASTGIVAAGATAAATAAPAAAAAAAAVCLQPPTTLRLVVNYVTHLVFPHLLRALFRRFFPEHDASDGVRRVLLAHVAWWWLWTASRERLSNVGGGGWVPESVSGRLSGLTSVSVDMRMHNAAAVSSEQYRFLGGLTLLRLAVETGIWAREQWRNRQAAAEQTASVAASLPNSPAGAVTGGGTAAAAPSAAAGDAQDQQDQADGSPAGATNVNRGVCPLCLEQRSIPTATGCGHVFCYSCVSSLLSAEAGGAEPRCPLCREVIRPQGFVVLRNFALPRSAATE